MANGSALTLPGRLGRAVGALGLAGCLLLAFTLPGRSVLAGAAVLAVGVAAYAVRVSRRAG